MNEVGEVVLSARTAKALLSLATAARVQRMARGVMRQFCGRHTDVTQDSPRTAGRRREMSAALHATHEAVDAAAKIFDDEETLWQECERVNARLATVVA